MSTHDIVKTVLGFLLVVGAPIGYKKFELDGFVCLIAFAIGISLIVTGHL